MLIALLRESEMKLADETIEIILDKVILPHPFFQGPTIVLVISF